MRLEDKRSRDVVLYLAELDRKARGRALFNRVVESGLTFGAGDNALKPRKLVNLAPL